MDFKQFLETCGLKPLRDFPGIGLVHVIPITLMFLSAPSMVMIVDRAIHIVVTVEIRSGHTAFLYVSAISDPSSLALVFAEKGHLYRLTIIKPIFFTFAESSVCPTT